MSSGKLSYGLLKTLIEMYDEGEIDESHPLLSPGIDTIRKEIERYEKNVPNKEND